MSLLIVLYDGGVFMIDVSGREWLEDEYLELFKQGIIKESEVVRVKGIQGKRCERCLNQSEDWFATFIYKEKPVKYCRQCLDFKMIDDAQYLYRSIVLAPITEKSEILNQDFQLSFLQQRASDFAKGILNSSGIGMIWAVCGAGKTEMMFETISLALLQKKRVCWAIPRADVVVDLIPRIKRAFPYARVVGLHGNSEEKNIYGDIVVTTTHQLIRFYQAFDLLIIDEVDAFPYTFDEMLPRLAQKACKTGCATIYLSATPSKTDQRLIKRGRLKCCLIPARYHLHALDIPKYCFSGNLSRFLKKRRLPRVIKKWFNKQLMLNRRALLFVPTIEMGYLLQEAIRKCFALEVEFVFSSDENRLAKVKNFKEGKGQFLITTMILERGVTIANIDVAIFSTEHEVFEESALVQISGRVGRNPMYPHGEIVFFHYGITLAMESARRQIREMNNHARRQKLLKEDYK